MGFVGQERKRRATQRAENRERRRSRVRLRRRIKRYFVGSIVGLFGLMIVLSLVLPNSLGNLGGGVGSGSLEQGAQVALQGNEYVKTGQDHPSYNTRPPTSGWHYDIPLENIVWGVLEHSVKNEVQLSYLERGAVMIQYNCPDECLDLQEQLKLIVNRYPEGVILAPYTDMETTIALTSWGWIDTLESFDDLRIDAFIQAHIGQGPDSFR